MQTYHSKEFPHQLLGSILTIGSFDGIHIGHQAILKKVNALRDIHNLPSVCISFHPHPREVLSGQMIPKLTCTPEKIAKISSLGVDYYWEIPFDMEFASLSPLYFLKHIVAPKLQPQHILMGPNHRFGSGGSGTIDTFHQLGYHPIVVPEVPQASSTLIRSHLLKGQIFLANQALGYSYTIQGSVVKGQEIGRTLGFPTANIVPDCSDKLLPQHGVYSCKVHIPQSTKVYIGALSIGTNPTISKESTKTLIEVHILDFEGDLYHKEVRIELQNFIRLQENFDSLDDLVLAMKKDIKKIQRIHSSE
jgi:riboflavin kinase/FMN adenylyltransferase